MRLEGSVIVSEMVMEVGLPLMTNHKTGPILIHSRVASVDMGEEALKSRSVPLLSVLAMDICVDHRSWRFLNIWLSRSPEILPSRNFEFSFECLASIRLDHCRGEFQMAGDITF